MAKDGQVTDAAGFLPWATLMGPPRVPARFPGLYRRLERRASALSLTLHSWGTTEADRALEFPCDRYFEPPLYCYFRGIEVLAPRDVVFRWLCQLRVANYGGLDLIDNFGRRAPHELTPGVDRLEAGQRILTMFELIEFERDAHLTMRSAAPFSTFFGHVGVTYRVAPHGPSRCRVIVKTTAPAKGGWRRDLFPFGELPLMRRQLRTFKRLAEQQFLGELLDGRRRVEGPVGEEGSVGELVAQAPDRQ